MENQSVSEGKTIAIIAYLWVIGLIIAIVMNSSKKNPFASFHIRQAIGIILLSVIFNIIFYYIYVPILPWILNLGVFVLWILGFIAAIQGEEKPVPVVGAQFQDWFKNIG
ncbi:DUF4870 domain-containing protein [Cochleicola gelatinilyticus]|uniref:Import component protein n=1 Tax=Cochleicola gelatinilyticus TaxID=1763537 RepID=A0A167H2A8_9FLAO|nr:hypothetical protein [Cochleicola gelatinilyticus]OAB78139.1 hypothetical protein ULVI_11700 [Cochleicola gelatinilyticus]